MHVKHIPNNKPTNGEVFNQDRCPLIFDRYIEYIYAYVNTHIKFTGKKCNGTLA